MSGRPLVTGITGGLATALTIGATSENQPPFALKNETDSIDEVLATLDESEIEASVSNDIDQILDGRPVDSHSSSDPFPNLASESHANQLPWSDGEALSVIEERDIDNDGVIDAVLIATDSDGDGAIDAISILVDSDQDGLADLVITAKDSDNDNKFDHAAIHVDTNGDGHMDLTIESIE
jgi:hypothetical protein